MLKSFINEIPDYINSDKFLFLDPELKEIAESLLHTFCDNCQEPINLDNIELGLITLLKQNISHPVKKKTSIAVEGIF